MNNILANEESYQDKGLDCENTYYYRVLAFNGAGDSEYSNDVSSATYPCSQMESQESSQLIAGPFLFGVTKDSATITWQTDRKGRVVVEYGSTESYGKQAYGQSNRVTLGTNDFYVNTVSVGGLEPRTWTHYRIVSLNRRSQDFSFRTAPAPGDEYRFLVYGDSRPAQPVSLAAPDDSVHQAILSKMKERNPDFVINAGDLVEAGPDPAEWVHFFSILSFFPSDIPYYPVLGNHDQGGESIISGFFGTPPDVYYSFDYGDSHFTIINSYLDFSPQSVQYRWLAQDLSDAKQREGITRLFAFMHAPAYCSAPEHTDDQEVRNAKDYLAPLFTDQGVRMVFQGHVHVYERTEAINGVVYIVAGGGGAPLHDAGPLNTQSWTAYKESANHFVEINLWADHITLEARYKDGTVFDNANYY
ncbi:MAG: metallophosphoesterase [bacterium]|nr:metallophosphoesterase [bacterium]